MQKLAGLIIATLEIILVIGFLISTFGLAIRWSATGSLIGFLSNGNDAGAFGGFLGFVIGFVVSFLANAVCFGILFVLIDNNRNLKIIRRVLEQSDEPYNHNRS